MPAPDPHPSSSSGRSWPYVLIGVFVLVGVALAIPARYIPAKNILALAKYFSGRHDVCSLSESWESADDSARQTARARELVAHSSVLQHGPDGADLWGTPDGRWWVPAGSRDAVLYDLAEQDRDIYHTGAGGIRPGDVVLDCGANVGVFVKTALSRGASRVIAIEPAPENLLVLRKNFAEEIAAGKVLIYPKGVWDQDGELTLYVRPDNSAADSFVLRKENSPSVKAPLTTIDHLVEELHLDRVDFIKMDIEGSERRAVAGAAATIRRFHPRMALCVYHLPDDPAVVPKGVLSIDSGYTFGYGCMHFADGVKPEVAHFRKS